LSVALASDSGEIAIEHLPAVMRERDATRTEKDQPRLSESDEALRSQLTGLLQQHKGNVSAVARSLSKERVQIRRWCRRFSIDPDQFR